MEESDDGKGAGKKKKKKQKIKQILHAVTEADIVSNRAVVTCLAGHALLCCCSHITQHACFFANHTAFCFFCVRPRCDGTAHDIEDKNSERQQRH